MKKFKEHAGRPRLALSKLLLLVAVLAIPMTSFTFVAPKKAAAAEGKSIYQCAHEGRLIQKESVGVCTKAAQYFYSHVMSYGIKIDGMFGDQTALITYYFQQQQNLTRDGKIGAETWNKIRVRCSDFMSPHYSYNQWVCHAPRYFP